MEEDGGVKVPVMRLRRRLSVEQSDDTKSPSAPSTPTKKRGRLAAKPQLELIDENAPQNSPKRTTRKSIARDVAEDEKPLTPARRITRVKSNTSIVSDVPNEDEKPQTPSRRSTRIKSNTSLISETINVDSPRAKRAAARRNSQLGSDTETLSVTPGRTRRTRKDSTSSVDIQETTATPGRTRRTRKGSTSSDKQVDLGTPGKTTPLTSVISEEPEIDSQQSASQPDSNNVRSENSSPSSIRKSPRLRAKTDKQSKSEDFTTDEKHENPEDQLHTLKTNQETDVEMKNSSISESENKLSDSSINLIKNIDTKTKKNHSNLNKSASVINNDNSKIKRHRTLSWTTLSVSPSKDCNFHSDNESAKKKLRKKDKLNITQAGPGHDVVNSLNVESQMEDVNVDLNFSKKKKQNKIKDDNLNNATDKSIHLNQTLPETPKQKNTSNDSNKENVLNTEPKSQNTSVAEILFNKSPKGMKTMVFMEDSDTELESKTKKAKEHTYDVNEDQCVPVVYEETETMSEENNQGFNVFNNVDEKPRVNDSCEPMDVDVTIPNDMSIADPEETPEKLPSKESKKSLRKSSQNVPEEAENNGNKSLNKTKNSYENHNGSKGASEVLNKSKIDNNSLNKSKRKSSSQFFTQDLEKSTNENKSTLILSQIKDVSNADHNVSKSPKVSSELSKSITITDIAKDGIVNKNLSINYLTSTPVQQKDNKKPGLQLNTSVITPSNESKKETMKDIKDKKKNISLLSTSSKNDTSDDESEDGDNSEDSKEKNDLLDSEAKDAGDDYVSGDSQDEEERQYEKDHEILEKGETLTSEEELSTDSDYEKDSFVVSSAEEDDELLSGSGEDLDMSDNELTMSAKSKKKYDERKKKEQKKASRQMYEARHKIIKSDDAKSDIPPKKNRLRLDSTLLESGDDNNMPPKKNKRMRLESTFETSDAKSDVDEPSKNNLSAQKTNEEIGYNKKKSKRLSESVCSDGALDEKEISINEVVNGKEDPLLAAVKTEPKTPQKDLDLSTIHFTCREEVENVQVNEDASIIKPNDSVDPLQATIVEDKDNSSDNSSISENEEIAKNYDSMLDALNKENKQKVKSKDMSLNLDKKQKKRKEPVIEELNLTIAKKSKKKGKQESDVSNEVTVKRVFRKLSPDDDNSIDLKLLFSEDSSDSTKNTDENSDNAESFIPLKRTEAKTNIRSSIDPVELAQNETLNASHKKKNRKSQSIEENTDSNSNNDVEVKFFIDTKGARDDADTSENISLNTNKKNKNMNEPTRDGEPDDSDSSGAPAEVSYKSEKNKTKSKSFSEIFEEENVLTGLLKTPGSEKKKKKQSEPQKTETSVQLQEIDSVQEVEENIISKTAVSEKKKKKKYSESQVQQEIDSIQEVEENIVSNTPVTEKKKKKKLSESQVEIEEIINEPKEAHNVSVNKSPSSEKKNEMPEFETENQQVPIDAKASSKKRKRKSSGNQVDDDKIKALNSAVEETAGNKQKKRKISGNDEVPDKIFTQNVNKNNKKRKEREEDDCSKKSKVQKQNSLDQIHIPRLPDSILSQLEDKPKKVVSNKNIVSTTDFTVEETMKRKNKPSRFLEETVCLNAEDDTPEKNLNVRVKKPKVLPFLPTVCTSHSGFTTKFQVTVLPKKIEFVAQSTEAPNLKYDYLKDRRAKKLRTYDLYKKQRNTKLSKY